MKDSSDYTIDLREPEQSDKARHRNHRRAKVIKDDRRYEMCRREGYACRNFHISDANYYDGDAPKSLHHQKAFIKQTDFSDRKQTLKKCATKKARQIPLEETTDGNTYKKSYDYKWNLD